MHAHTHTHTHTHVLTMTSNDDVGGSEHDNCGQLVHGVIEIFTIFKGLQAITAKNMASLTSLQGSAINHSNKHGVIEVFDSVMGLQVSARNTTSLAFFTPRVCKVLKQEIQR